MRPTPANSPSPELTARRPRWPLHAGWITALSVTAIVAVNAAGVWGIAVAKRGAREDADRIFRLETAARARSVESVLASARADMAFLAASPSFARLEKELSSSDPREARWRRLAAEGAILLFLRGHTEVSRVVTRSSQGAPLVAAGRRGGVPVLWKPSQVQEVVDARSGVQPRTSSPPITGVFDVVMDGAGNGPARLEAQIDGASLLARAHPQGDPACSCALRDRSGGPLTAETRDGAGMGLGEVSTEAGASRRASLGARDGAASTEVVGGAASLAADHEASLPTSTGSYRIGGSAAARDDGGAVVEVPVRTEGWSAPTPWTLTCVRAREAVPLVLLEPVAARYRLTLFLNVLVMGLGLLLGGFAIHQSRRRQRLETEAAEEARVRELERRLLHAERLSTVGRLAAGMAHEINNPLEGMSNYLKLASEDLARGEADAANRRLDGVREGLERAAGIVRQVLAHADPAVSSDARLDLKDAVNQAVAFVRSRREFQRIRFGMELRDEAIEVRGSPIMLGQVFLNLLLNACEAQPDGGEVLVRADREGADAIVQIADRGPGVPEADRTRVFEPFYSTKQSTGLGLSVCHSIVQRHRGELSVAHREGGGATFTVRLRAAGADHF